MKKEYSSRWRKLDNAAQAFPAATGKKDTRVFRFYCQLKEDIQADLLQKALEQTMEHYPVFSMVLRKGLFWFYLEQRDLPAKVEEEKRPPCSEIYVPDHKTLLFQVSYYKTRINFEVFHALTDGTGAMLFLKELVSNYLILCHPEEIFSKVSEDMLTETDFEEDSFSQYYTGKKNEKEKSRPAYQIKGEYLEQEEMEITEILLSAEAVHKCAKAHGVSVTAYLAAALVYAVYEEIPKSRLKKPVSLMVPANLRNFFPSASMTNFWSWIEIACDLGPEASFEDALQITGAAMQKEALKQEISTRMNDLVRIERNPVLRAVPLEIKNLALMAGTTLGGRSITTVYSNIGRIQMPPEYETYIERFGFFTSTDKVQMCSCSYGDSMVLGITSKIADSNIERNLMHLLQKEGIVCEQEENDFPGQKEQPHGTAKLGLKIFSFTCIAAVVLCWMMNFLATPQMWWAGYATAGVFCAWLLIRVGYQKRKNPLKNSMWQLIFIMIGAILWDYATGWIGWSVDFAIPLAVLLNGATMQILARAYKMEVSEYLFYLMQSGAAGIVPAILWLTGTVRITWPSVICVGLSVLYLIGLFFFRGKDFMREMQKKFRV